MARPSEPISASPYASLAESLRGSGLPECCRIEVADDRLWLLFPESDFVMHTRPTDDADGVCLTFSVAVRAPEPSLETWWDKWSVSADRRNQVAVVVEEIVATRNSVLRMLEERFGRGAVLATSHYA